MATIFLSYRREDSAGYAGRLCESLERRLGKGKVFRDVDTIRAGEDFVDAIHARLKDCHALLVLIGREWVDAVDAAKHRRLDQPGDYLRQEIETGLSLPGVLVVPVLVEGMTMPAEENLPESIRALARHQAVSLRDETWDADVERLATAITGSRVAAPAMRLGWVAAAVVALMAIPAVTLLIGRLKAPARESTADQTPVRNEAVAPAAGRGGGRRGARGAASAIAIPRASEIASPGSITLVYSLLSGAVAHDGDTTTLSLRLRVLNDGGYSALVGNDVFRLAVGPNVLAPVGSLGEVVPSHSTRQVVVRFHVPAETKQAVLQVRMQSATAELPLDLSSIGRAADPDQPDTGDALSRAILTPLVTAPRPLINTPDVGYTLVRASVRRFVNALRIVATVRMANRGRFPAIFGVGAFRLVVDGAATAPVDGPNQSMPARSDASGDVVFDVAPTTRIAILRVIDGDSTGDLSLDLTAAAR